jgi:homeobox-leucine zipper protein
LQQVVTLTEKLQGKETSPSVTNADHLDEHTAASGTEKLLEQQLRDDLLSSGDCTGHGALSSEEEDGGVVSDEGCSFHLPDALFAAAEVTHHGGEEAQLFNWTSWYWNN